MQLTIINQNGKLLADSREVAEMTDKRHDHLMRDIDLYVSVLNQSPDLGADQFFIESSYSAGTGRTYRCYLLTRKGCDMVANKMTGEKGILFTATYVSRFDEMEKNLQKQDITSLSPLLQTLIQMETRQNALEQSQREMKQAVTQLTDNMTAVPDSAKVVDLVNEYARFTRLGHNEIYNKVYEVLKDQHGIDVRTRVTNERELIQDEYHSRTGKWYAEKTLKDKVNGMDVMVRIGCLDKFHSILSGMLSREKIRSQLSIAR